MTTGQILESPQISSAESAEASAARNAVAELVGKWDGKVAVQVLAEAIAMIKDGVGSLEDRVKLAEHYLENHLASVKQELAEEPKAEVQQAEQADPTKAGSLLDRLSSTPIASDSVV